MSMFKLAMQNFKSSFKSYLSLIISLSFTILVLANFINLVSSGILNQLGEWQSQNIEVVIQVLSVVVSCFMLFFVWYATNVFLIKRKKDIGIYVFMGLSNQKIGKLYMIESILIGIVSLVIGISVGVLTSRLFVMIIMKLSEIAMEIHFNFTLNSLVITCLIFIVIYTIFVLKGYINIVRSSVLDMMSANKQNEYVEQKNSVLIIKSIMGILLLSGGFYLAIKEAGLEVIANILMATIMVIIGIYFFFGGIVPLIFQTLVKNKKFLYHNERSLWINNMIFRMKKNYRTYAMVCILMLCSVSALGFGFAMKNRSDNINHFENTYTFQVLADKAGYADEFESLISKENDIAYSSEIEIAVLPDDVTDNKYEYMPYSVVSYSSVKKVAESVGFEVDFPEPKDYEYVKMMHLYLLTLINDNVVECRTINDQSYKSIGRTSVPYLGYMQEDMAYMIVSDKAYEQLRPFAQTMYFYNYKIVNPSNFEMSVGDIQSSGHCLGLVKIDPAKNDNSWINIMFSVSFFTFMVFVMASASIMFMKVYNDSYEEKERYIILKKLGVDTKILRKAIAKELLVAYIIPIIVMSISSYFSIQALANLMSTPSLWSINVTSLGIIYIFFIACYFFSKVFYQKNVGI